MSSSQEFAPDSFFNNAAAVFVILIFAKSVSYRFHGDQRRLTQAFHVVCVIASASGLAFALLTTQMQWNELWANLTVWGLLAVAGLIFVVDEIWQRGRPSGAEPASLPHNSPRSGNTGSPGSSRSR